MKNSGMADLKTYFWNVFRNRVAWRFLGVTLLAGCCGSVELNDGAAFSMDTVPEKLIARLASGGGVCFSLEENGTTGYQWEAQYATNAVSVVIEHRGAEARDGLCGAPGKAVVTVTRKPGAEGCAVIDLAYRRSWEKGAGVKRVQVVLETK